MSKEKRKIFLGYPLDLLLNTECKFDEYKDKIGKTITIPIGNGISLPLESEPGSGNIVIRGKPGTAKSTLALQLAISATKTYNEPQYQGFNNCISFYISLEETPDKVSFKAKELFGKENNCKILEQPYNFHNNILDENQNELFKNIFTAKMENESQNNPVVIITTLVPRNISPSENSEDTLFLDRFNQLENLLSFAKRYNEKLLNMPKIGMICIDSLNVFGDKLLSRTELFRLFDLFKRNKIIGIFVVEEDERSLFRSENDLNGDTIEYLADVVISLSANDDEGYFLRYFEITKSRYIHQVYGKHPFKLPDIFSKIVYNEEKNEKIQNILNQDVQEIKIDAFNVVKIFPSIHYLVSRTDLNVSIMNDRHKLDKTGNKSDEEVKKIFFDGDITTYLPKGITLPVILLIEGPRATFKTMLARDFLLRGLFIGNEHVMFIRFIDTNYNIRHFLDFRLSEKCIKEIKDIKKYRADFELCSLPQKSSNRRVINYWESKDKKKRYTELIIKSGYILPEEFIYYFFEAYNYYNNNPPTRIVLDEIGKIGSSYPLLHKSKTSGEFFLTAFIHLIRNYGLNLVITGTRGEYEKSDYIINQAKTLVDSVLTTKNINVFGDNYVTITGEGIATPEFETSDVLEKVPGVIKPLHSHQFKVDKNVFQGLVGFDTERIYRPGIFLSLFEEQKTQSQYNDEIEILINSAFGNEKSGKDVIKKDVVIFRTNLISTIPVHDSLRILEGKPLDKTVICAIDEFFRSQSNKEIIINSLLPIELSQVNNIFSEDDVEYFNNEEQYSQDKGKIYTLPYYDNVLLLVINMENLPTSIKNEICNKEGYKNWEEILQITEKVMNEETYVKSKEIVDFDPSSEETLSCILLDTIFSTHIIEDPCHIQLLNILETEKTTSYFSNELNNLRHLLKLSSKKIDWLGGKNDNSELVPNSFLYICWYSSLRHLINSYPDMANNLKVFALPGGGFKGDWHLGILRGSVSASLGYKVLRILCDEKEDYKRFVKGVGLPTSVRFYTKKEKELIKNELLGDENTVKEIIEKNKKIIKTNKCISEKNKLNNDAMLLAWQNSKYHQINEEQTDPDIFRLFRIHENAKERRNINNYLNYRNSLSTLMKQLTIIDDHEAEKEIDRIIVKRMKGLIQRLTPDLYK